jgi:uncharacterized repeat protein (TIGR03803 family)
MDMMNLGTIRALCLSSLLIVLATIACAPLAQAQTYTDLFDFIQSTGSAPGTPGLLAQGQDGNLYSTMPSGGSGPPWAGTIFMYPLGSNGINVLYYFSGTEGFGPMSGLNLGLDGNFYGTTYEPVGSTAGDVFKVTPSGALTVLYQFTNGSDGAHPFAPPVPHPDGNLYGVTYNGTVLTAYKITPAGAFSVIATLPGRTVAPLIVGTDGNLYGTTQYGGKFNAGTVFQLTTKGKLKIIHEFKTDGTDGTNPAGPLMQGRDGKFYGTTAWGGAGSSGVVYQVTTAGKYAVLHSFTGTEGTNSATGLVQGSDGFLYGVTSAGGGLGFGTFFKVNTTGTTFAVLHNFDKAASGGNPLSTPVLHTSGIIYGLTATGPKEGTLYSMNVGLKPFASLFVLWSGKVGASVGILGQGFSSATGVKFGSGAGTFQVISDTYMIASPAQGSTTSNVTVIEPGGNLVTPQVFKVIPSIKDFSPSSGPVGTAVTINGMSLTQATAVTFGGVKATNFTVNSDIQITAIVPVGAKTGTIGVTTKGGKATSSQKFTVQ